MLRPLTTVFVVRTPLDGLARRAWLNDALDQRPKELDSLKELLHGWKRVVPERHLRLERAEKLLRMDDIADAVHLRVFLLGRALPCGELREIGHEPCDEALEEGHHEHDLRPRESSHEQANVLQIP